MLSVRVLGELALELDGAPVEPPAGRRARSLLGLLALDRRLHARSDMAARFWPDVLDESARGSLRSALMEVRRSLAPDAERHLVATRERVGLGEDVWTDADAFAEHAAAGRLREAMELYRGDLLSGLDDDWVLAARDEWRERAATVLAQLAVDADEAGDPAAAIAYTRRIVALDPLAEEGQRALIRRLAAAGDRPAALAAYGRYAERLRTELRIAPSPATRALVDELRVTDDDEPGTAVAETAAQSAEPATSGTVTLLVSDLVGSAELLTQLGDDEAERLRRVHAGLLRDVARRHCGQAVKPLGDGLMVAFGSSLDALACAVAIQRAVERDNGRAGTARPRVRVGLTAGESLREHDDYVGTSVLIARRLCGHAEGGQILASDLVRQLMGGRDGFEFRPVGELDLEGVAQSVAACEVAWERTADERIALPAELGRDDGALVGRATELAVLQQAWSGARAGRLGVMTVAGEPGIGKTRLVAELCRRAHADGATVLLGRCHEETLTPYEPFVEALRRYVGACPADELRTQMGAGRRALATLVPELGEPGSAASDGNAGERYALFDAIGSLLREAAIAHPVIVVLEDLHWADEATLLLVRHLARAAPEAPLLIVGTCREEEVRDDAPLTAALAELRRARLLRSVALSGLDQDEVAALIRGLGVELAQTLQRAVALRSEGNPFFVEEIVRHLDPGEQLAVPQSVKDLLRRRLRRLGEPANRALAAAAVLGREFDLDALRLVVGGEDEEEVLRCLDEALAEHVVVAVPDVAGRLAFSHALIRETVHEELSPARRPLLHRRAGEALEQLHPTRLDALADRLAQHYVQAGDDEKGLEFALRAARAAWRVYAPEAAIVHHGAALESAGRIGLSAETDERVRRVLLERGWMREVTGDLAAGVADYGRALAAARVAHDRRLEAEALDSIAFAEGHFDVARSGEHHREALVIAAEVGDVALQIRILSRMSLTRATNLDLAGALEAAERSRELAEGTGDDRDRMLAIDALKLTALQLGDLERLDALTSELEEIERRRGDLWYLQWTLLESAFVPLAGARWEAAADLLDEALALNRRVADTIGAPMIHDARCWLQRSRGDLGAALTAGRLGVRSADGTGATRWGAWTRATLGWALLDLRAAADAVTVLERGLAEAAMLTDHFRVAGLLAWAHTLTGDGARADEAVATAERALAEMRVPPGGAFLFGFGSAAGLARAHLAAGRPERGEAVLAPLLAVAGRTEWHEATASLSLVGGLCRAARSDVAGAAALLRCAIEFAERHGLPGVDWEARLALAQISDDAEATRLRAASAAVVQRLAGTVGEPDLAAAFVRAAVR